VGKAVAHLSGTYDSPRNNHQCESEIGRTRDSVDDLEAVLPAVGVILPPKSQLKGGTLAVNFSIVGPVDKLVETGTIRMQNRRCPALAWARRCPLSPRSRQRWGRKRYDHSEFQRQCARNSSEHPAPTTINLAVPSLGTVTGAGTVSASNALDFKMKADAIPFLIQGTTADPKFVPDMKGMRVVLSTAHSEELKVARKLRLARLPAAGKAPH